METEDCASELDHQCHVPCLFSSNDSLPNTVVLATWVVRGATGRLVLLYLPT